MITAIFDDFSVETRYFRHPRAADRCPDVDQNQYLKSGTLQSNWQLVGNYGVLVTIDCARTGQEKNGTQVPFRYRAYVGLSIGTSELGLTCRRKPANLAGPKRPAGRLVTHVLRTIHNMNFKVDRNLNWEMLACRSFRWFILFVSFSLVKTQSICSEASNEVKPYGPWSCSQLQRQEAVRGGPLIFFFF